MRFTVDEAFEFQGTEEAIILGKADAGRILAQHGIGIGDVDADDPALMDAYLAGRVDAGKLFAFLGY